MLTVFYTPIAGLLVRLAIFLGAVILHMQAVRVAVASATGNQRSLIQLQDQVQQLFVAFLQIILLPQMVDYMAKLGVNGFSFVRTEAGQLPWMNLFIDDVLGILTGYLMPLALFVCKLAVMAQGVYNIIASTTSNMFIQRQVWFGTVRWLIASATVAFTPFFVAGLLQLLIQAFPLAGA